MNLECWKPGFVFCCNCVSVDLCESIKGVYLATQRRKEKRLFKGGQYVKSC